MTIDFFDPRVSPGSWAALRGMWRGFNKYDHERMAAQEAEAKKRAAKK